MKVRSRAVIVLVAWWYGVLFPQQTAGLTETANRTTASAESNTVPSIISIFNSTTSGHNYGNTSKSTAEVTTVINHFITNVTAGTETNMNVTDPSSIESKITEAQQISGNVTDVSSTKTNVTESQEINMNVTDPTSVETKVTEVQNVTDISSTKTNVNMNVTDVSSTKLPNESQTDMFNSSVNEISQTKTYVFETVSTSFGSESTEETTFTSSSQDLEKTTAKLMVSLPTTTIHILETSTVAEPTTTTPNPCQNPSNVSIHLLMNVANATVIIKAVVGYTSIAFLTYPLTAITSVTPNSLETSTPAPFQYIKEDKIYLNVSEDLEDQSLLCSSLTSVTWLMDVDDHFHIDCVVNNTNFSTAEYLIIGAGNDVLKGPVSFLYISKNVNKKIRIASRVGHIFFGFQQENINMNDLNKVLFTLTCTKKRISYPSKNVTTPVIIPPPPKNATIHLCLVNLDQNDTDEFMKIHSAFRQTFVELIQNKTFDWPPLKLENATANISVNVVINHTLTIHSPFRDKPCRYSTDPQKPYCVCFYLGIVISRSSTTVTTLTEEQLQQLFDQIIEMGSFPSYRIRLGSRKPDYFLYIAVPIGIVGLCIIIFYVIWRTADWDFWNRNKGDEIEPPSWRLRVKSISTENPVFDDYLFPGWQENQVQVLPRRSPIGSPSGSPIRLNDNEEDVFVNPVKNSPTYNKNPQISQLQKLRINPLVTNEQPEKSPGTPTPSPKFLKEFPLTPEKPLRSSLKKPTPKPLPEKPNKGLKLIMPSSRTPLTPTAPAWEKPLTPTVTIQNTPLPSILSKKGSPPLTPFAGTGDAVKGFPLSPSLSRKPLPTSPLALNSISGEISPTSPRSPTSPTKQPRTIRFSLVPNNLIDLRDSTIYEEEEDTDL